MSTLDIDQARVGAGTTGGPAGRMPRAFPGPLKATVGPLPLLAFLRVGTQLVFFVSWIAAIGLTELPFFVSWTATPIFRKLAEEKGSAYVLIYPLS